MKTSRHHRIAQLLLWVTPALWSSNYLIARTADGVIAPNALTFGRWSLALLLMLPFAAGALFSGFAQWRHEWKQMLVLGALGTWICGVFVYIGAHTTSATNIGLIYAATPMAIALAGALVLHERVTPRQRAGMALALCGVVFVIAEGDASNLLAVRFTVGDGWVLAAAASWVAYTVLLQRWPSCWGRHRAWRRSSSAVCWCCCRSRCMKHGPTRGRRGQKAAGAGGAGRAVAQFLFLPGLFVHAARAGRGACRGW